MFKGFFGGKKTDAKSVNMTPNAADDKSTAVSKEVSKEGGEKSNDNNSTQGKGEVLIEDEPKINPHFICPITGEIMMDPVVDNEGEFYLLSFLCAYDTLVNCYIT